MEEASPEKTNFNYNLPSLFGISNPSDVQNTSMVNVLGVNSFDPLYSSISLGQKNEYFNDNCLKPTQNSAELLKSFKQQWYKSGDTHQYKHLPFHTNICKRPPKIQRTDNSLQIASTNSSSPKVNQLANVAPADPSMLEKILTDPTGYINVQGKLREVRFYGEKSIVMMDWNDPRDVCFQSSSRRVIIDDKDIVILSFNSPYTNYTFPDGSTFRIRLGAPTRDFYIDGEPVDIKFGGPPINVLVGDSYHKIQLGGPSPKVYVGNVKRRDIMAGRINLIVDEDLNNIFHVYLDPKPQKVDVGGVPFILRFANSLQTVFINERPFKTEFGGDPIAVKLFNVVHLFRFSALPPGIVPGIVHIVNMQSRQTDPVIRNLFPSILPANDPKLTSLAAIVNNNHYHFNYCCDSGESGNTDVSKALTTNSNLLTRNMLETRIEQNTTLDANGVDVINLYQKLVEKGIICPPLREKEARKNSSKSITIDFSKPKSLKLRNMRIVYELYSGAQCDICSLRFMKKTGEYASHIDWHCQMKRHSLGQSPNWWCHPSEFPRSEQDIGHITWFEKQKRLDPFAIYEQLTVPAKDHGVMPTCSFCYEEFNQFYDEVADEWLLRNAVVYKLKLSHPICCLKENQNNLTSLQVEMNMITPKVETDKISNYSSQNNTATDNDPMPTLEQYDTVLPCNIIDNKISTDANIDELFSNKIHNRPLTADYQDEDMEVVVIQPEMEVVDLSKDDINNLENNTNKEMGGTTPLYSSEAMRAETNEKPQNQSNEYDPNGHAEPSLILDYTPTFGYHTEFPSTAAIKNIPINLHPTHSSYNIDPENIEMDLHELPKLIPETVKPLIMDSKMIVQPDVITAGVVSAMCSIM